MWTVAEQWITSAGLTHAEVVMRPLVRRLRRLLLEVGMHRAYRQIRFEMDYRLVIGEPRPHGPFPELDDTQLHGILSLLVTWWLLLSTTGRVVKAITTVRHSYPTFL